MSYTPLTLGFQDAVDGPASRLEASARFPDGRELPLWFQSGDCELTPTGNALFCAGYLPAMRLAEGLRIENPVCPHLREGAGAVADLFTCWHPGAFHRVELSMETAPPRSRSYQGGAAAFFTGGLDSCHTLLKHREEIDTLLYVHGFDLRLENQALRREVSAHLRSAAREFGKRLIEVETNLMELPNQAGLHWGYLAHGAALATVAHLLEHELERIYIPASSHLHRLIPFGSHPLLDPLWSSAGLRFFHDGCEASRFAKAEQVARSPESLRILRVCWENRGNQYNCGECEKCIRTMMHLEALDALERCPTFPHRFSRALFDTVDLSREAVRLFYEQTLDDLRARNLAPAIQEMLRERLDPPPSPAPPGRAGRMVKRVSGMFWKRG